jgi:hypothetical protein
MVRVGYIGLLSGKQKPQGAKGFFEEIDELLPLVLGQVGCRLLPLAQAWGQLGRLPGVWPLAPGLGPRLCTGCAPAQTLPPPWPAGPAVRLAAGAHGARGGAAAARHRVED